MNSTIRNLVERKILWKYLALILALVVLSAYLLSRSEAAFSAENVVNGIFYSVVTSLIVSLFYDIGTRRDMAVLIADERDHLRRVLSERLLAAVNYDRLQDGQAEVIAKELSESERMMSLISTSLLGEQGNAFFYTWLKPLVERRVLYSVVVENRLGRVDGRSDVYAMQFRQAFRASPPKTSYTVIFTCDHDLYYNFATSGLMIDELVGTSTEEWRDIDKQVTSLSFQAYRKHLGRRESIIIGSRQMEAAELGRLLNRPIDNDVVRAYEFKLQSEDDWTYEYSYQVLNRLSDPYYYWIAVNPMFVSQLVIDYRDLKPMVGRVSASCGLGSASSEPHHDVEAGRYIVNVESLVWPGQGAVVVWRPRPPSPTPSGVPVEGTSP